MNKPKYLLSLSTILFAILSTPEINAKKLYKYQDEKGIWHFSDKQPETDLKVEVRQMKVAKKKWVWIETEGPKTEPDFYVQNTFYGPIELKVSLHAQNNVRTSPPLPERFIIYPGKSAKLFEIRPVNPFQSWGYGLQYSYVIGDPKSKHDFSHLYLPPIAPGAAFQVTQGFNGSFSHHDEQNKYAIDIAMPIGTPIHAARSGVVMKVENDFFKGGTDNKAYLSRANSIRILHDDGSMAIYAHLELEKAQVYPGQRVQTGQLIAYSGNTGFTSGPHLHFSVQVNKGMKLASVPFKFADEDGKKGPSIGSWLTGVNPAIMQGASHEISGFQKPQ